MANFSAVFSLLQADLDSEDHDEDSGGSEIELIQVNCGKKHGKPGDRHPQSVSPRDLYDHSFDISCTPLPDPCV